MRLFAVLVLLLGLGLAGGAAFYVFNQVQMAEARLRATQPGDRIELVELAIAKRDLKFGQTLTADDVYMMKWPKIAVPENGFTSIEELLVEGAEARTVLRRMERAEPILKTKITGFGEKATVAALLAPGMVAHTIPVNAVNSVGGFVLPGARIDVYLTLTDRGAGPSTRLLTQDLEVVAVDQDTDPDRTQAKVARTVTVQGTSEQVRELTLAGALGSLSIALRGLDSGAVADLGPLNRSTLLGEVEETVVQAEPVDPGITVRVRRANSVEVNTLN